MSASSLSLVENRYEYPRLILSGLLPMLLMTYAARIVHTDTGTANLYGYPTHDGSMTVDSSSNKGVVANMTSASFGTQNSPISRARLPFLPWKTTLDNRSTMAVCTCSMARQVGWSVRWRFLIQSSSSSLRFI